MLLIHVLLLMKRFNKKLKYAFVLWISMDCKVKLKFSMFLYGS